jgi:hypothetical protein
LKLFSLHLSFQVAIPSAWLVGLKFGNPLLQELVEILIERRYNQWNLIFQKYFVGRQFTQETQTKEVISLSIVYINLQKRSKVHCYDQ